MIRPCRGKSTPIDGKDGRPHTGPFVETSAERDRKKAKESGDDDKLSSSEKPLSKPIPSGTPDTNDGVMDDPNRKGPKEGTRGTEGGISEKSREKEGTTLKHRVRRRQKNRTHQKKCLRYLTVNKRKLSPANRARRVQTSLLKTMGDKPKEKEVGGLEVNLPTALLHAL